MVYKLAIMVLMVWFCHDQLRFIEGDFDAYVKRIQQPYVWGGEPELLMASHVLKWVWVLYFFYCFHYWIVYTCHALADPWCHVDMALHFFITCEQKPKESIHFSINM